MPDRGAFWQGQIWQVAFIKLATQKVIWQCGEAIWPDYFRLVGFIVFLKAIQSTAQSYLQYWEFKHLGNLKIWFCATMESHK